MSTMSVKRILDSIPANQRERFRQELAANAGGKSVHADIKKIMDDHGIKDALQREFDAEPAPTGVNPSVVEMMKRLNAQRATTEAFSTNTKAGYINTPPNL